MDYATMGVFMKVNQASCDASNYVIPSFPIQFHSSTYFEEKLVKIFIGDVLIDKKFLYTTCTIS